MNGRTRTCARAWPSVSDGRDAGEAGPVAGPEVQSSYPGTRGTWGLKWERRSAALLVTETGCVGTTQFLTQTQPEPKGPLLTFLAISDFGSS